METSRKAALLSLCATVGAVKVHAEAEMHCLTQISCTGGPFSSVFESLNPPGWRRKLSIKIRRQQETRGLIVPCPDFISIQTLKIWLYLGGIFIDLINYGRKRSHCAGEAVIQDEWCSYMERNIECSQKSRVLGKDGPMKRETQVCAVPRQRMKGLQAVLDI